MKICSVFLVVSMALLASSAIARKSSYRVIQGSKSAKSTSVNLVSAAKSGKSTEPIISSKSKKDESTKTAKTAKLSKLTPILIKSPTQYPVANAPLVSTPTRKTLPPSVELKDTERPTSHPTTASPTENPTSPPNTASPTRYPNPSQGDTFHLLNPHTNKFIAIKDGTCNEGNTIALSSTGGQWTYNEIDSSIESIECSGMVLDIFEGDDAICENGLSLIIARKIPGGRKSQSFKVEGGADADIIESVRCPGMVVDIHGYGSAEHNLIYVWTRHNEWNQIWVRSPSTTTENSRSLSELDSTGETQGHLYSDSPTMHINDVPKFRNLRFVGAKASKVSVPLSVVPSSTTLSTTYISGLAGGCDEGHCLSPSLECSKEVYCLVDPCFVPGVCSEKELCTANQCGGCHAVCSPKDWDILP